MLSFAIPGPRGVIELVALSFSHYLEIEDCCRPHQGHSALSSTAFAGLQTLSCETGSSSVTSAAQRGDIIHSG